MNRLSHLKTWKVSHYTWFVTIVFIMLFVIVELRNWAILMTFFDATGSVVQTVSFAFVMFSGLTTLFSPLGSSLIVLFALLFSLNVILLYQYIMLQRQITEKTKGGKTATAIGTVGTVVAALGIGCASCGTAILFGILSLFGASGLILALPLHGQEFSIIGVAGLLYSCWYVLGKLQNPFVCEV